MLPLIPLLALARIEVTFVRHGETVANATGKYNARTLNSFSATGKKGVAELTVRLQRETPFDVILVSPSERALRTIAPYLRATRRKATIWPLLYECCTGKRQPKAKGPLAYGAKITIPTDLNGLFVIEPGHDRLPVASDYGMGLVQVDASLSDFHRFAGRRMLIVGHSGHGGQFIHALTGKWIKVENTKEIQFSIP